MISFSPITHHGPSTIDTLLDDAEAVPPPPPSITALDRQAAKDAKAIKATLKKGPARLAYIKERLLGANAVPMLNLSAREIAAQVNVVKMKTGTDDSILDEEISGVTVESEVAAAFDEPTEVAPKEKDATTLLNSAERRQLAADLEKYRAQCRAKHLPTNLIGTSRVLGAV